MHLLRGRLSQVHDTAHDTSHRRHVARQRRTVHDGAEGAVRGHRVSVQPTRVMGRHVSMQAAPLQVRLHREHIFFPVRVQLGRLYENTATKQRTPHHHHDTRNNEGTTPRCSPSAATPRNTCDVFCSPLLARNTLPPSLSFR
jgi:hypothetical protein